jgi:hypothetical protein
MKKSMTKVLGRGSVAGRRIDWAKGADLEELKMRMKIIM